VVGLLLIAMIALGLYMSEIPRDLPKVDSIDLFDIGVYTIQFSEALTPRTFYFNLHKSMGVTILLLILFRVYWRFTHPAPDYPASMKDWEKTVADLVHKGLYFLMLALPATGILMSLYSKYGLLWFGIPLFEGLDNEVLRDTFKEAHEVLAYIMIVMIVLHVLAAIKHKVIDKDEVMTRISLRR
jgi:cytochrome b561